MWLLDFTETQKIMYGLNIEIKLSGDKEDNGKKHVRRGQKGVKGH